jgi:hypothetical protein
MAALPLVPIDSYFQPSVLFARGQVIDGEVLDARPRCEGGVVWR